jgi:hypothetical protein
MVPLLFATVLASQIDAPAREPQLAVQGQTIGLTFGAAKAVYFSVSHDRGLSFSTPVKVAEAEILPLNRHRGPRIAMLGGGAIVISAVGGKKLAEGPHAHGLPSDGDLLMWRSTDGGKTWSRSIRINDVAGAPTEGLHALAADAKGNLFAAWLDKRSGTGTELYGARSTDGGRRWSTNARIYASPEGTICQCCHPSVAVAPDGQILVMWRNWLGGSRDMYLSRSRDGVTFTKAEKIGTGTWPLNACPMDGGGIAVAGQRVVTAWRRDGEIFTASPGEAEVKLGQGIDVAIAPGTEGGVYAVWTSKEGLLAAVPGGKGSVTLAPKGTFPSVVALTDGGALAAWEAEGKIEVQPLR